MVIAARIQVGNCAGRALGVHYLTKTLWVVNMVFHPCRGNAKPAGRRGYAGRGRGPRRKAPFAGDGEGAGLSGAGHREGRKTAASDRPALGRSRKPRPNPVRPFDFDQFLMKSLWYEGQGRGASVGTDAAGKAANANAVQFRGQPWITIRYGMRADRC